MTENKGYDVENMVPAEIILAESPRERELLMAALGDIICDSNPYAMLHAVALAVGHPIVAGMSMEELANRVGIDKSVISRKVKHFKEENDLA